MEPIRNERLTAALDRAVREGNTGDLLEELARGSNLPGPRPNLDLARAVGHAIAAFEGRGDPVLRELVNHPGEYPRIVAAMTFAARSLSTKNRRGGPSWARTAQDELQELAEDPRHLVRMGIVEALRLRIATLGEPAVVELAAWTDGYLQAHVALEALAHRELLTTLPSAAPVLARLDEAFHLADESPRAAERSQGMRTLRQCLPAQIAVFSARYGETLEWLETKTRATRPETREVVALSIAALRRTVISDLGADRLSRALNETGKPPRDPSRIVQGTRKRSRGRR